ncbi:MAG: hypothetical protein J6E41_00425, partial [Lachnospiraceae bacterium]|nr:hypothetical protein [Lachnospiraceae bacterium]
SCNKQVSKNKNEPKGKADHSNEQRTFGSFFMGRLLPLSYHQSFICCIYLLPHPFLFRPLQLPVVRHLLPLRRYPPLLLCVLVIVLEPTVYALETQKLQLQELQIRDAATAIALISAKQGVRELVRLILFAFGALSFLSMGGFWGKDTDKARQ